MATSRCRRSRFWCTSRAGDRRFGTAVTGRTRCSRNAVSARVTPLESPSPAPLPSSSPARDSCSTSEEDLAALAEALVQLTSLKRGPSFPSMLASSGCAESTTSRPNSTPSSCSATSEGVLSPRGTRNERTNEGTGVPVARGASPGTRGCGAGTARTGRSDRAHGPADGPQGHGRRGGHPSGSPRAGAAGAPALDRAQSQRRQARRPSQARAAPIAQPARTSVGQWTPRYSRPRPCHRLPATARA